MAQRTDATTGRRRLGRGLQSLIAQPVRIDLDPGTAGATPAALDPGPPAATPRGPALSAGAAAGEDRITLLPPGEITANANQPRRTFDEQSIARLAESIRRDGFMQPIVVRPKGSSYEIVAGERRWRAARLLQLAAIPTIVRAVDDRTSAEWSLIENLQREDLNPVDRAEAFERLIAVHGLTHQVIAERVGLDRSSITNHLRLVDLDDFTKDALRAGALTMGHGRALLAITNNVERTSVARRAIQEGWSVRELERRVRLRVARSAPGVGAAAAAAEANRRPANLADLERRLGAELGTKVVIRPGRKKGTGELAISFFSFDEFDGLMARLGVSRDDLPVR